MLLATINFRAQPHKRAEALGAVDSLVQRMRGYVGVRPQPRPRPTRTTRTCFLIASEWQDTGAAEAFFRSREFQIFKGVRILMRDEPLIVLDDVRAPRSRG